MTSAVIKNNHATALGVGGVSIPGKGGEARIQNWVKAKNSNAVAIWLEQGLIEVVSTDEAPVVVPELPGLPVPGLPMPGAGGDDDARKQALIDELATFGIDKTKRSSIDTLERDLASAKEAATKKPSSVKRGRS